MPAIVHVTAIAVMGGIVESLFAYDGPTMIGFSLGCAIVGIVTYFFGVSVGRNRPPTGWNDE